MIRKRVPKLLTILASAACIFGFVLVAPTVSPTLSPMPTAGAQVLGNGYDVNCTKASDSQVVCTVAGCPRVFEDLAGDVVHTHINHNAAAGKESPKACGNTFTETVNASGPFTYSIQGCRKHTFETDDCGAYSHYEYVPPAAPAQAPAPAPVVQVDCPAGSPTPKADSLPQCAPVPPKDCPPGSAAPQVPAGQSCAPPANAVSMNITRSGANANVAITNSSALAGSCAYVANKTSGLVGPASVNRTVDLPANGTATINDLLWPLPLTSYHAKATCTGTYDGKQVTLGVAESDVSG